MLYEVITHFGHTRPRLWMPHDQLIRAGRNVVDFELAISIGQRIIGIIDRHRPAFHVGVKPALHVKGSPPLIEIDGPHERFSRRVVMDCMDVTTSMLKIHDERRVV